MARSNRSQRIIEAVISGQALFQGREFFDMLRDIQQAFLEGGTVKSLIKRLNTLESVTGGMMQFDLASKSVPPHVLFTGASFSPSTGIIWIHLNPNLGSGVGISKTQIAMQMAHMQSYIEHEYVHMTQQGKRMDAGYSGRGIISNRMGFPIDKPLSQYKQERQAKTPDVPVHFQRHMSVGVDDPTVGSWYQAQPDEVMAWAVQLASLVDQQRRKNPAVADYLSKVITRDTNQVFKYLAPRGVDTPAFNRFRKYMVEYLINHLQYSPHSAGQMVTQLFQATREVQSQ